MSYKVTDKKTALYNLHLKEGGKMVSFAGWLMPLQFTNVKEEHLSVRNDLGLFDVSHMGEIFFKGPKALASLQYMTTNDVAKLKAGQAHYTLIQNEKAGIVDDVIVYCLKEDQEYLVCVNAANIEKDYQHFLKYNLGAEIENQSDDWSQIAIQGPNSPEKIKEVLGISIVNEKAFSFLSLNWQEHQIIIAKTGYTGETGVEIFLNHKAAPILWQKFLDLGAKPIGLAARDTLRLEKKLPLYGNELNDETNPSQAKLNWVVKPDKGDFLAKPLILKARENKEGLLLVGLKLEDKGIARSSYSVFKEGKAVGHITSGTMSPSLNEAIAIAYVDSKYTEIDMELSIDIRGRKARAKVVKTPFI